MSACVSDYAIKHEFAPDSTEDLREAIEDCAIDDDRAIDDDKE